MVRGKTQLRRIENAMSRQVTFSKRRSGLLKKAFELSVLCDAEVGLIIFSTRGKLYEFSSSNMQKTIERYQRYNKDVQVNEKAIENVQDVKNEVLMMAKKIEALEVNKRFEELFDIPHISVNFRAVTIEAEVVLTKKLLASRKLLGESLDSCSTEELQKIESQLERTLTLIRVRKIELFKEKIQQLKEKERVLSEENSKLREKFGLQSCQPLTQQLEILPYNSQNNSQNSEVENEIVPYNSQDSQNEEVETELFIGRPERGSTRQPSQRSPSK